MVASVWRISPLGRFPSFPDAPNTTGSPPMRATTASWRRDRPAIRSRWERGRGTGARRRFEHSRLRDGLRAGVDRLARLLQLFREVRNQASRQGVKVPVAVDEPNDRRVHRRRHVPGRRDVRQWVHRREQSSDELSREETGVTAAHAEEVVTSAADATKTTAALAARKIAARAKWLAGDHRPAPPSEPPRRGPRARCWSQPCAARRLG
jgi:hypothetical protein